MGMAPGLRLLVSQRVSVPADGLGHDRAGQTTRENGCLQVLRGSHQMGRLEHELLEGQQVGADLKRVEQAEKVMDRVYCEMAPGDVLFFHCNTLHRSDRNTSDSRRWTLICCYNAARNSPFLEHHHPGYTPLMKVPDSALKQVGLRFGGKANDAAFLNKAVVPADLSGQGTVDPG